MYLPLFVWTWIVKDTINDYELLFNVNVLNSTEPFKIAVNGYWSTSYSWKISIDWWTATTYSWNKSTTPISITLTSWTHTVLVEPTTEAVWWARCIWNWWGTNYWNDDKTKLTFWLSKIPWYAFMESASTVWDEFLYRAWRGCASLTTMPSWFNIPSWITTVWDRFLYYTWYGCASLTTMPSWFNLPSWITTVWDYFLYYT